MSSDDEESANEIVIEMRHWQILLLKIVNIMGPLLLTVIQKLLNLILNILKISQKRPF